MSAREGWPRTSREIGLALRILGLLLAIRLLIRLVKLETLLRWLTPATGGAVQIHKANGEELAGVRTAGPHRGSEGGPEWNKAARYTDALLRRMPSWPAGPCLPRALTLHCLARRAGLPVQFHCGVRREGTRLQGHAWLTLEDQPFLEPTDPQGTFAVTFTFPPSPARP